MSSDLLGMSDEIESVLFIAREVLVYRLPPRTSTEGYKAASWNNDSGMLWKGRMRVLEKGDKCEIRLEDALTGELFAMARYTQPFSSSVEPVLDSSRYFVLRVEGEGGKRAYIGMGFEERGDAFDFNVALQSFAKRITNPSSSSSSSEPGSAKAPPPTQDFSLKAGQTFSIKVPGREGKKPTSAGTGAGPGGAGNSAFVGGGGQNGIPLLAPPPPSSRRR